MRYQDRILLSYEQEGAYDAETETFQSSNIRYPTVICNVNPISTQRMNLEFGNINRYISIVRVKGDFDELVTHAYLKNKKYKVIKSIKYRLETVYYIEEVVNESKRD